MKATRTSRHTWQPLMDGEHGMAGTRRAYSVLKELFDTLPPEQAQGLRARLREHDPLSPPAGDELTPLDEGVNDKLRRFEKITGFSAHTIFKLAEKAGRVSFDDEPEPDVCDFCGAVSCKLHFAQRAYNVPTSVGHRRKRPDDVKRNGATLGYEPCNCKSGCNTKTCECRSGSTYCDQFCGCAQDCESPFALSG